MLNSPHCSRVPVGRIGFECGFKNEASFNRRFLTHFNATPGTVRAQVAGASLVRPEIEVGLQDELLAFRQLIETFADSTSCPGA
jgi:AraC-like DNA-binding protein